MRVPLQFAMLGLAVGGVYALLAQGIVLIYRGSGIVNFAQGAMAMLGAFLFYVMRVENNWNTVLALVCSVASVAAVGYLTHRLVMRPLAGASSLARQIATLGVLTTLLAIGSLVWGEDARTPHSILPTTRRQIGEVGIGEDRLWVIAIACALTALLWWYFRRTTLGLATSAVAERPRGAALLGWSPDLVAALNWTVGAALAGLAGILIAPLGGLAVASLTFLVIPALAIALAASFRSFPVALVVAFGLGIMEAEAAYYASPQTARTLAFVLIIVLLIARGSPLPIRGELIERLPGLGSGQVRPVPVVATLAVAVLAVQFLMPLDLVRATTTTVLVAIMVLSLVVVTGLAGQIALGQYAIGGVGALVAGKLIADAGWGYVPAVIGGVAVAVVIGVAFALPALRTRGVNLAVVTLAMGTALQGSVFRNEAIVGRFGITIGPQEVFGIRLDAQVAPRTYAIVALCAFAVLAVMVANLRRSVAGRRMIAVRSNERAAASLGISVVGAKIYAFAVAAGIAGLGGILIGFQAHTVLMGQFDAFNSILIFSYGLIGGIGYAIGPALGSSLTPAGLAPVLADKFPLFDLGQLAVLAGGIGIVVILYLRPDGLASIFDRTRRRRDHAAAVRMSDEPAEGATVEEAPTPHAVDASTPTVRRVPPVVLHAGDVSVTYGAVQAVSGVTLQVDPGVVVGLIGPNGAGKTSLLDALSGYAPVTRGTCRLDDQRIDRWQPHRRARAGIGRSFQGLELFDDLTVRENLQTAGDRRGLGPYLTSTFRPGKAELGPAAQAAVEAFDLTEVLDELPSALPNGIRHEVAIARAVAAEPSVLLLDEPAAGLDEAESRRLAHMVRRLAEDWGMGILVVEHDMAFVMSTCDRITVLDFGAVIAEGPPAQIAEDPAVVAAYLGQAHAADDRNDPEPPIGEAERLRASDDSKGNTTAAAPGSGTRQGAHP